jgi:hypothetical protein
VKRIVPAALIAACAVGTAGCSFGNSKAGPESNDKRGEALNCLQNKHHLDARLRGEDQIQVGDARTGPWVRFFLTRGEAESAQFRGKAEGSIESGSALIFVRRNSDPLLTQVEDCIDNLS